MRGSARAQRETSPAEIADREDELATLPHPDTMPAWSDLHVDPEGLIWAQEYTPPWAAESSWSAFAPDGRWIATLVVPGELQVTDIGRDFVLAVVLDEFGVEYVRMYGVERAAR